MKTVTCAICGEQVSKRKSLAYKDGRACRVHDEVEQDQKDKKFQSRRETLEHLFRISHWRYKEDEDKLYFGYMASREEFRVLASFDEVDESFKNLDEVSRKRILDVVEAKWFGEILRREDIII